MVETWRGWEVGEPAPIPLYLLYKLIRESGYSWRQSGVQRSSHTIQFRTHWALQLSKKDDPYGNWSPCVAVLITSPLGLGREPRLLVALRPLLHTHPTSTSGMQERGKRRPLRSGALATRAIIGVLFGGLTVGVVIFRGRYESDPGIKLTRWRTRVYPVQTLRYKMYDIAWTRRSIPARDTLHSTRPLQRLYLAHSVGQEQRGPRRHFDAITHTTTTERLYLGETGFESFPVEKRSPTDVHMYFLL